MEETLNEDTLLDDDAFEEVDDESTDETTEETDDDEDEDHGFDASDLDIEEEEM